jgi:ParB family transcriptional regulator, chromosome partitioning protein
MVKKNSLGRGLGALIEEAEKENPGLSSSIDEIALEDIDVNPWQPRAKFDEDALQELADSIREIGIIQPITVRLSENGKYQLITGERRFRAAGINNSELFLHISERLMITICLKWHLLKIFKEKTLMQLKWLSVISA